MKLKDFKVEQWMNENEGQAKYNLTDTCASSFSLQELLNMGHLDPSSILLDYGEIVGKKSLRQEILNLYQNKDLEQITTTNGCLEANTLVMDTLLEPEDHVITCVPGYQQFVSYPESLGCTVSLVHLDPAKNWSCCVDDFSKHIGKHTKLVILNNPNNPTGTVFTLPFLEELIVLCRKNGIYILCDEVYRDPQHLKSISDLYEKGISTSSFSKLYGLAGLRLGWIKGPRDVIKKVNARRDYVMISTGDLRDTLGLIALQNKEEILKRTRSILQINKEFLRSWLETNPDFSCVIPAEGTVAFLQIHGMTDSKSMAQKLLEQEGIFFVPGSCFDQEGYMRLGLGQDPQKFQAGLKELAIFLKSVKPL